jgi:hypothetical protein
MAGSRQDRRFGVPALASLLTHQVGVTLVQSIATGLAVGTTLKFVGGVAARGVGEPSGSAGDPFDAAEGLPGKAGCSGRGGRHGGEHRGRPRLERRCPADVLGQPLTESVIPL